MNLGSVLGVDLHEKVEAEAARQGKPKAVCVREAVEQWLAACAEGNKYADVEG
jgi:hypothetical protein